MSTVKYDAGTMSLAVEGLEDVRDALGELSKKTPAAVKVAINAAAREIRKEMIEAAKKRYAINDKGVKQLKQLKRVRLATNARLETTLRITSMRNDLAYFQMSPKKPFMGRDVLKAPDYFKGKVLKSSQMKNLGEGGGLSKGFLVEFKSGHVGAVQRVKGTGKFHYTERSGAPSWSDKMQTMGSPSATAMHHTIWKEIEPKAEQILLDRMEAQVMKIKTRAKLKK